MRRLGPAFILVLWAIIAQAQVAFPVTGGQMVLPKCAAGEFYNGVPPTGCAPPPQLVAGSINNVVIANGPGVGAGAQPGASILNGSQQTSCYEWVTTGGATLGSLSGSSASLTLPASAFGTVNQNTDLVLAPSTTYTLTAQVNGATAFALFYSDGTSNHVSSDVTPTGTPTFYSFTFTTPGSLAFGTKAGVSSASTNAGGTDTINHLKLETGSSYTGLNDTTCVGGANLVVDCNAYNTSNWSAVGSPSTGGSTVNDPFGVNDAQLVTFTDPRSGYNEQFQPALAHNATYTATVFYKLSSGTPDFYLGYYNGSSTIAQYSSKLIPTSSWQRSAPLVFTTGANDSAPSIAFVNANVDLASQGNTGTAAIFGLYVEPGSVETAFPGCVPQGARGFFVAIKTDGGGTGNPAVNYDTFVNDGMVLDGFIGACGTSFNIGSVATGGDSAFIRANGSDQPPVSLKMFRGFCLTPETGGNGGTELQNVASGNYDTQIQASLNNIASDITAGFVTKVIRIGWESGGGGGFQWTDNTTNGPLYVAAFRHICAMAHITIPSVKIEWNGNLQSDNNGLNGAERSWRAYYPGDDCVDMVSTDLYFDANFGINPSTTAGFNQVLTGSGWGGTQPGSTLGGLNFMDAFAAKTVCTNCPNGQSGGSKMMSFGELGTGAGGPNNCYESLPNCWDPAGYITNLGQWAAARNARFYYLAWWDGNDSGSSAVENNATSISAWKAQFK